MSDDTKLITLLRAGPLHSYPCVTNDAADRIEALIAERETLGKLLAGEASSQVEEMRRAEKAEAEVERLRGLLREARLRLDVHGDLPAHPICKRIDAALATEDKP